MIQYFIVRIIIKVFYTKLQSCHCEERSDVAIYPIEPALVRLAGNRLLAL